MDNTFATIKAFVAEIGLDITREDAAEQVLVIDAPDRGLHHLVLDCENDILVIEQLIAELAPAPAATYAALLTMNRSLVHGAFCLDEETGRRLIFRDTLALENIDCNEVEASINALTLMLAEYSDQLIDLTKTAE